MTFLSDVEDSTPLDEDQAWIWEIECEYGGPVHEHPSDWIFGGPHENDPRADPRWRPSTYVYFSDKLEVLYQTQTPLCEDQAIDEFTIVAGYGPDYNPVYLSVKHPNDEKPRMLPLTYDKKTDTVTDNG